VKCLLDILFFSDPYTFAVQFAIAASLIIAFVAFAALFRKACQQ
jgi:hypothetical protein